MEDFIGFFRENEEYGFLSNFAHYGFHYQMDDKELLFFVFFSVGFLTELALFDSGEDNVGDDTEDQSGSDGSDGDDLADGAVIRDSVRDLDGEATDTGD